MISRYRMISPIDSIIFNKHFNMRNFKIVKEDATWDEAHNALEEGNYLSHKNCPGEWVTKVDNYIVDHNGEYHDYDEWCYLHRGGQWESGFIIMK